MANDLRISPPISMTEEQWCDLEIAEITGMKNEVENDRSQTLGQFSEESLLSSLNGLTLGKSPKKDLVLDLRAKIMKGLRKTEKYLSLIDPNVLPSVLKTIFESYVNLNQLPDAERIAYKMLSEKEYLPMIILYNEYTKLNLLDKAKEIIAAIPNACFRSILYEDLFERLYNSREFVKAQEVVNLIPKAYRSYDERYSQFGIDQESQNAIRYNSSDFEYISNLCFEIFPMIDDFTTLINYLKKGQLLEAEKMVDLKVDFLFSQINIFIFICDLYIKFNQIEDAKRVLDKVTEIAISTHCLEQFFKGISERYILLDQLDKAEEVLRHSLSKNKENMMQKFYLLKEIAKKHFQKNQLEKAIKIANDCPSNL